MIKDLRPTRAMCGAVTSQARVPILFLLEETADD